MQSIETAGGYLNVITVVAVTNDISVHISGPVGGCIVLLWYSYSPANSVLDAIYYSLIYRPQFKPKLQ